MHIATLSSAGLVEIPLEVQESLDLHPGARLALSTEPGTLIFRVLKQVSVERETLRDLFTAGPSLSDALLELKRNEAKQEDTKWNR